jgi:hypothetical protein
MKLPVSPASSLGASADAWLCPVRIVAGAPIFKWGKRFVSALEGEADFAKDCTVTR